MTAAVLTNGHVGIDLAALLGLKINKREGHDLAGPCIACNSSDAFRLHVDTGVGYCHSCEAHWSPFEVAKTVLNDPTAARDMMTELGIFDPTVSSNGLDGISAKKNGTVDPIAVIARMKSITTESLTAYGAKNFSPTEVRLPVYGPDKKQCSYFRLFTNPKSKGKLPRGGKHGLFLPHVDGKVLLPQPDETWHLVEGCKDAAALHELGLLATGLPTSSMNPKFARLFAGVDVIIIPDRDAAGETGAQKSGAVLTGAASSVRVATLPAEFRQSKGDDVRDVLKRPGGRELLLQAIDDAQPWKPTSEDGDDRPEIEVTPDEHLVNDQAVKALANDRSLYQRGGLLAQIFHDESKKTLKGVTRPANAPRITILREPSLRERLSAMARFVARVKTKEGEELVQVHPPSFCTKAVAARGHWPGIRHLEGVINSPILRADGTILQTPGYDPTTGLYYEPDGLVIDVPSSPTRDDARAACNALLEVVVDFPFATPIYRASWLAFVITPLARHAYAGPSPLFLIDANVRASGKSLLADSASLIFTGRDIARMSCPNDDAETRKRITAITLNGDPMVLIDNVAGEFGSASLDAALTGTMWKDRILGRSEIVEMPLLTTWAATGNNVVLMADTSRRVCHIRLNSKLENPEERQDFRHPNLKKWLKANRPRLLASALTILSAYCRAGRPDQKLKAWGSFEGWSDLVRQALVWVGMPDPGETREELARSADHEAAALRALIQGWPEIDTEGTGVTAAKALALLEKNPASYETLRGAVLELGFAPAGKLPGSRKLGNKLRHLRGRVVGGKCMDRRDSHGTAAWFVADVGPDTSSEPGGQGCSSCSGCSDSGRFEKRLEAVDGVGMQDGVQVLTDPDEPEQPESVEEGEL